MEVVHDGAAQMAKDEPEHGLENFLGCRRHAGRVSQAGMESRIIVLEASDTTAKCPDWRKSPTQDPGTKTEPGAPSAFLCFECG